MDSYNSEANFRLELQFLFVVAFFLTATIVPLVSWGDAAMYGVKQDVRSYALAALSVVAALFLRRLLNPFLGGQDPYHTIWLAIVFSAWYCGIGPSIVASVLAAFGLWYWFFPPYNSFALKSHADIFGIVTFLIFAAVMIGLGAETRHTIWKHEQAEKKLRNAHVELESQIARRTEELQHRVAEVSEKAVLLDLANDAIFAKTSNGMISYWNQGAERLYGWTVGEAIGHAPHDLFRTEFPIPLAEIQEQDRWEGELRQTKRDGTQITVVSRWTTLRDASGKPVGWLEINTDVTARKRAEESARSLSGRILTLQDEERRKMARGLHDSLGQYLAGLKMNLDLLSSIDEKRVKLASECAEIVDKCVTETRTVSHLLHPPLLDESGFGSAARWYVDGFAERSGIAVNLNLPPRMDRLPKDVETTLFRTLQEGLTNVHRHSGASAVNINVRGEAGQIYLEISDNGRGIPDERLTQLQDGDGVGVGLAGMRERVRELRGSMEIHSGNTGTQVSVAIPLPQRTSIKSVQDDGRGNASAA
ncbi:MAG: DUF4118 domain-containing protein [Terriglobales bacterium]